VKYAVKRYAVAGKVCAPKLVCAQVQLRRDQLIEANLKCAIQCSFVQRFASLFACELGIT
jgi:hypothetical protein